MKRVMFGLGLALLALLMMSAPTQAAELIGEDVYRLPSGETIDDDLYIGASEVFIDGTVNGDLIAAAGYLEINGTVTGDVMAVGGGVVVNGTVGDDVRAAGGGLSINGNVGGDVVLAGGGGPQGAMIPMQMGNRSVTQGIFLAGNVAGDAIIVGGEANLTGNIGGDLTGGLGTLRLDGRVGGNVDVDAGTLAVGSDALVDGRLTYTTESEQAIAGSVSEDVVYEAPVVAESVERSTTSRILGWLWRTALVLVGFAALGWLMLRYAPEAVERPVAALQAEPGQALLYGLLAMAGLMFIPLVSALLIILVGLFWGVFPAIVVFLFLFSSLALLWVFSPIVTGLWIGGRFTEAKIPALLIGVLLLALVIRIPVLGWFVALVSFILALGAFIVSRRPNVPQPPFEKAPEAALAM